MLIKPILMSLSKWTKLGLNYLIINFCGITILFKSIPQYYKILCEVSIFL